VNRVATIREAEAFGQDALEPLMLAIVARVKENRRHPPIRIGNNLEAVLWHFEMKSIVDQRGLRFRHEWPNKLRPRDIDEFHSEE
jgi:hypothetical protein